MVMAARYTSGLCPACGMPLRKGQPIGSGPNGFRHADCKASNAWIKDIIESRRQEDLVRNEWYDGEEDLQQGALARIVDQVLDELAFIARTKPQPEGETPKAPAPTSGLDLTVLPEGGSYYAVPNADGKLTFLKVDRPKDGKWGGWTFVRQYLGGQGPAQRLGCAKPGQGYSGQWPSLMEKVLADPKGAAQTFGQELGKCARCHADLTDETSRAQGLGPVCVGAWE